MDKILFIGRQQKQCRDTQHQTGDSRRFEVDLPLIHRNNTGYITANYLVGSSNAGKSCTETAALSRRIRFVLALWSGLKGTWSQCKSPTFLAARRQQKKQAGTSLFSLLHDMPTRVRSQRANSVCSFTLAYAFVTQSAWAPLGLGWQLFIPHFSPKLEVTYETSLTWKSTLAELSGKINTSSKYLYPQTT